MQKYSNTVADPRGNVIGNATITVTTLAGAPATIYSDNGSTVITSLRSNSIGYFEFYAADGHYNVTITKTGSISVTLRDILLEDPADAPFVVASELAATTGAELVGSDDGASGSLWTTVAGFIARVVSAAGSSVVGFIQAGFGAIRRSVQDRLRDTINVKDFGAVGDGIVDDTAAFLAAWNAAILLTFPRLYLPAGTYNLETLAAGFEPVANLTVYGDGMDSSKVKFDPSSAINLFYRAPTLTRIANITFRDIHVEGGHGDDGDYSQISSYPFQIYSVDDISLIRVKVTKSRTMAVALRGCSSVKVQGCTIRNCARDGINTADCSYVNICGNLIEYVDDDAIACHAQSYGTADRSFTVVGNTIRFAQGIRILGAKSAAINSNTIEFFMSHGISVESLDTVSSTIEGVTAGSGISIIGNVIKNGIDRAIVDALNSTCPYIIVGGDANQAGSLAAIPGENDAATGTIVPLYPYFENSNNGNITLPIPGNYNITICGNTLTRDVDASGLLSALGFGVFYTRNGNVDPTLTSASMRQAGVWVRSGILKNATICANNFMGISAALYLDAAARLVNGVFDGNTVFDCTNALSASSLNTLHQGLYMRGNVFDIDPLHTSTNRGTNGTFLAAGNPTILLMQNTNGVAIGGNIFRNAARISDISVVGSALIGTKLQLLADNYIECDPTAEGFSTSNKGIGDVPRGPAFILRVVDSDPASANFGKVLNYCPASMSAMPTSGKYVKGHFVRNNNPAVAGVATSQYIITGWSRLTTGSGHVLNTDWREMRALTGT